MMGDDLLISIGAGMLGAVIGYGVAWAVHRWRHRPGLPFDPRCK